MWRVTDSDVGEVIDSGSDSICSDSRMKQPSGNVQMVLRDGHHEHIVPLQIRGHEIGLPLHEGLRVLREVRNELFGKPKTSGNHALIKKSQNKVSWCVTIGSSLLQQKQNIDNQHVTS